MPRPPLGPIAMDKTVKFRLRADEFIILERIANGRALSQAIRDLIHDEYHRMRHPDQ